MKILIIGNLGYIGPVLVKHLKDRYNNSWVAGYDTCYFAHNIISEEFPENILDVQYMGDVREFPDELLNGFDSVVYLAAISNDPMGEEFKLTTEDINQKAAIDIAKKARKAKISHFVYASSCSVYGFASEKPRTELSELNPLTTYAKSKVNTESKLKKLASDGFIITCLRFATACGFSPRLRLDLVLNDFVANALLNKEIEILSDGTPWRPLIHVKDMSRAIEWAISRDILSRRFLIVNTGSNEWNYQIKDLAFKVKENITDISVNINKDALPDKRSYKVDFSLYKKLAKGFQPLMTIEQAVNELKKGLIASNFRTVNFRDSALIRLNTLRKHIKNNKLNTNLNWIK